MMPPPRERWFRYQRYQYLLARTIMVLAVLAAIGATIGFLRQTLTMLLVAFFLAYLLNPILVRLERRGFNRTAAVWIVLGGALLATGLVALIAVPLVLADLNEMARTLPPRIDRFVHRLPTVLDEHFGLRIPPDFGAWVTQFADEAKAALPAVAKSASRLFAGLARGTASFFELIAALVLIPFFAFYFMRDFRPITRSLYEELVPPRLRAPLAVRLARVDEALGGFVRGQLTVSSILAVVYTVGLAVSGVPLAFVIGPVAGLGNMVPFLGTLIGVVGSLALALLAGTGWETFLGIAITFTVGQTLEGFVLTPRIVGERVGLSPFGVILAVALFGEAFGFVGVLLAVPTAAVLKILAPDARRRWRESRLFAGEPPPVIERADDG